MKDPHDIIKRPVLTEKAYEGFEEKRYVFEVDIRANKAEIKNAMEGFTQKVYQIFGKIYQQQAGGEQGPMGGAQPDAGTMNDDGSVNADGSVE